MKRTQDLTAAGPKPIARISSCNADPVELYDLFYCDKVNVATCDVLRNWRSPAQGRLAQSFAMLKMIDLARERSEFPHRVKIMFSHLPARKCRAGQGILISNLFPIEIFVGTAQGQYISLSSALATKFDQVLIERYLVGPTIHVGTIDYTVHRLLALGGGNKTLALAANMVAVGHMSADEAMTRIVEPGYQGCTIRQIDQIERNMRYIERIWFSRWIVDGNRSKLKFNRIAKRIDRLDSRAQLKSLIKQSYTAYSQHIYLDMESRAMINFERDRFLSSPSCQDRPA